MGELVEVRAQLDQPQERNSTPTPTPDASASSSVVRWERFLPKLSVRVLLVEADDSTRHIIAALLRKCSYKVAAVPDGLKAWEVLKGRSRNIDLILTEVELPSISGYALLTLIMEHDVCKNIPVIMMSAHDSVATVYKCMLRGASDYLVKPIRKNELRNLWQHVWRKQVSRSAAVLGPPDESVGQQKIEATAENNDVSNHSSGYMACIRRNRECIEKGSDAQTGTILCVHLQSSCTKPELENEGADAEHFHCPSQPKASRCPSNGYKIHAKQEKIQAHEGGAVAAAIDADANDKTSNDHRVCNKSSSRKVIDLIGNFESQLKGGTIESPASNASTNKFDILPQLDLSLRRSHPSSSVNQVNDETRRLNHSDASAFSRYIGKPLQSRNSTSPSTCNQHKDRETNSDRQVSNQAPDYNSDTHAASFQPGLRKVPFPYNQQTEISPPIPVSGVKGFGNVVNGLSPMMPQVSRVPSGLSPLPNPTTATYPRHFPQLSNNPFYQAAYRPSSSPQFNNLLDQGTDSKRDQKLENLDQCHLHASSANNNDQSGGNSSSFYNGHHYNSMINSMPECGSEDGFHVQEGASHRAIQREVALTKFRMKRKERCFEKKVRYESRKKLAEQRPRVKGQFVRQVPNDLPPGSSSAA
ncbi:two-component response regulator-like APRR5 isoform X2 [Andrographis paniculata]|uniref:two-component response regulator-like APRR5 isoform X2 n=1 Tax=Andrographis paniculata TaxID=175694 RepID=UPI0021E90E4C|nr:two-component response regulator-like APRR5 isoform X2 [Andrographis paniculata]